MPISVSSNVNAALVCVGSELLRGKRNTHVSTLARRLSSVGITLAHEETRPDQEGVLATAIRRALQEFPLVIVTGGLGPTFDDVTREAAAKACGHPLVFSRKLAIGIRAKFRRARYRRMPPANERQAYLLQGAEVIRNANGTAPGQWLSLATPTPTTSRILILLPGPPREMHPMLENSVLPRLRKTFRTKPRAQAHLHFVGIAESLADQAIRPILTKEPGADFTILAHLGLVDLDVFVTARTRIQARARCRRVVRRVLQKLGRYSYGHGEDCTLEKVVGLALRRRRATVALAESCTGGLLSARLTDIPGSSDYVLGGVVSYSNRIKEESLGIPPAFIRKHGAVSSVVAQAMAEGIRRRFKSTWGVGVTGIAGPGGAIRLKPRGLVYVGVAGPRETAVRKYRFGGDRDAVRQRSVVSALNDLRLALVKK